MKVLGLLTLATSLALAMPGFGHVLPLRNVIDNSGDNNATTDNNNTTQDLGKFNGTWHVLSMEQDIYKEMQKVAKKYNTTCTCPQLTLTPVGSVGLDANASCMLQNNAQVLSHGLLTLLPQRRKAEYSFALLFSRFYIDRNDTTDGSDTNHTAVPMDSGVKGNLFWSFYSSNNGSDDVAFVRSKHMISGDNKHDVPDVNMVLSTSQDASYNATAIPGLGKNHKWDYVTLDKCNSTSTQPSETSSGQPQPTSSEGGQSTGESSNGQPQPTSSEGGQPTEGGQQPTQTSDQPQSTETSSQPQPTETSNDGGQQQGNGDQQQGDGGQQQGDGNQQGNGDQQQGDGGQQQGDGNQQGNGDQQQGNDEQQQGNGDQQQGNDDQQQTQQ